MNQNSYECIFDTYMWTEERKVLTEEYLIVPGLEMFGHNRSAKTSYALSPHIHQTTEFLYITNGTQKYYVNDKEYTLKGNQVLIVDENTPHSTGEKSYGRHENFWFRIDIEKFAQSLPREIKALIIERLRGQSGTVISLKENLSGQLHSAFYSLASDNLSEKLCGYAKFVDFITQLVSYSDPAGSHSNAITKVISYIDENICSHIKLEELAALCSLSLSGFKQKFRKETGITPREYINIKKIEKAKELLSQGMSVTDTAFALDFSSSNYFSVLFKQLEDVSPSEYRKINENNKTGC